MSKRDTTPYYWAGLAVLSFACLVLALVAHKPDRPVPTLAPGSSSGPAFVAQIIRPRMGLPLFGILPPGLFGVDPHLVFDSEGAGASIGRVGPDRIELAGDGWELDLVLDGEGRVSPETQMVFELVFEDRPRKVRCRPADPAVGTFVTTVLEDTGELSGHFDIELPRCDDADTGEPLGWPPRPFVLHGSFDRLATDAGAKGR